MERYIDKFRDELMDKFLRLCNYNDFSKLNLEKIADTINEIYDKCVVDTPTADVVEVVRCKDCKHAYFRYNTKDTLQEIYACKKRPAGRTHKKVGGDFFCKHGERRTDNEKR